MSYIHIYAHIYIYIYTHTYIHIHFILHTILTKVLAKAPIQKITILPTGSFFKIRHSSSYFLCPN